MRLGFDKFRRIGRRQRARFASVVTTTAMLASTVLMNATPITGVAAGTGAVPEVQDAASAVNYATILGRGVDFGIIADKFLQMNHMQTNYAVDHFANYSGDVTTINLIPDGSTSQILIGNVDIDRCGVDNENNPVKDPVRFDDTVAGALNIEGTEQAIGSFDGTESDGYFNINNIHQDRTQVIVTVNSETTANIQRIINNVYESSDLIQNKIANGYAINKADYINYQTGRITLPAEDFANKVVYIDVDNALLQRMNQANGIQIVKDSSTVVIFNISDESGTNGIEAEDGTTDAVHIDKYSVSIDGGNSFHDTDVYSDNDEESDTRFTDREICQKIIWNITSNKNVNLFQSSGLFIAPNSSLVDVKTTCAGWVVADNLQNSKGEWHYIYHGGSQDVNYDHMGQIHFAARKAFTHSGQITGPDENGLYSVVEDTTVPSSAGDFTFIWQEYNKISFPFNPLMTWYQADPNSTKEISNKSTSKLIFPTLTFYSDEAHSDDHYYVEKGSQKDFYFRISEKNAGTENNGIKNSTGFIWIRLTVSANAEGGLSYHIYSYSYYSSDYTGGLFNDPEIGNQLYKKNEYVKMSGPEFSLGALYNEVTGSFTLQKMITNFEDREGERNYTFYVYSVDDQSQKHYYNMEGTEVSFDQAAITVTVPADKDISDQIIFKNLPAGKYYISEAETFEKGYNVVLPEERSVVVSGNSYPNVIMTNDYQTLGNLTVSKKVTGDTQNAPESYKFVVATADEKPQYLKYNESLDQYILVDEKPQATKFTVTTEDPTEIKGIPSGTYCVIEEGGNVPDHKLTTTYSKEQVTITGDPDAENTVEITNNYRYLPSCELTIEKTFVGQSSEIYYKDCVFVVSYEEGGQTYYVVPSNPTSTNDNGKTTFIPANAVSTQADQGMIHLAYVDSKAPVSVILRGDAIVKDRVYTVKEVSPELESIIEKDMLAEVSYQVGETITSDQAQVSFEGNEKEQKVVVTNTLETRPVAGTIEISKQDLTSHEELEGAQIRLTGRTPDNSDWIDMSDSSIVVHGSVKERVYKRIVFESGKIPTVITGLPDGTYTLHENAAPSGYDVTTDIEFTIENGVVVNASSGFTQAQDGQNALIVMYDKAGVPVEFSKKDATSKEEIAGATMWLNGVELDALIPDVIDMSTVAVSENTKVVYQQADGLKFISGTTPTTFSLPDGSYTLTELIGAPGYDVTTSIRFEVRDGKVNPIGSDSRVTPADDTHNAMLVMFDEAYITDVVFSKVDSGSGNELPGAEITLTGVDRYTGKATDFTDVEVIISDEVGNEAKVVSKDATSLVYVSGTAPTTFKLKDGTYTFTETLKPKGYAVTTEIVFTIKDGVVTSEDERVTPASGSSKALVVMPDDLYLTDVEFSKKELVEGNGGENSGEEIPGATMTLVGTDLNGETIDFTNVKVSGNEEVTKTSASLVYISQNQPTKITLPDGHYTLHEETAPTGFATGTDIKFDIVDGVVTAKEVSETRVTGATENKNAIVTMFDQALTAKFSILKLGKNNTPLSGVVFELTDGNNKVIEILTTNANGIAESEALRVGTYYLKEKTTKPGYQLLGVTLEVIVSADTEGIKITIDDREDVTFEITTYQATVINREYITDVVFSKQDAESGEELAGAKMTLTGRDLNDEVVDFSDVVVIAGKGVDGSSIVKTTTSLSYVSGDEPTLIKLKDGTYTLTEETAPNGYKITSEIVFRIEKGVVSSENSGVTPADGSNDALVVMLDNAYITDVDFSKKDLVYKDTEEAEGAAEIPGAKMKLSGTDLNNHKVDFTNVEVSGNVDANVTKTADYLEYISVGNPTTIKLKDGHYTLEELTPPTGYATGTDIEFDIVEGVVTAVKVGETRVVGATAASNAHITMFDGANVTNVDFSKKDAVYEGTNEAESAAEIPGAKMTLVGTDLNGKPIDFTNAEVSGNDEKNITRSANSLVYISADTPTTITLKDGYYTLTEDTAPAGYDTTTEIKFEIKNGVVTASEIGETRVSSAEGDKNAHVTMFDKLFETKVDFSKKDVAEGFDGAEIPGAEMVLTGTDLNGNPIDFTNAEVSGNDEKNITR
ncbi:MAG: hypothetical protein J5825_02845, partial [Lachnospiraceae bacterium]|nr:hypothetical protein [Lachnospiraceae bacterium]